MLSRLTDPTPRCDSAGHSSQGVATNSPDDQHPEYSEKTTKFELTALAAAKKLPPDWL